LSLQHCAIQHHTLVALELMGRHIPPCRGGDGHCRIYQMPTNVVAGGVAGGVLSHPLGL
jgi:hypothetical protein